MKLPDDIREFFRRQGRIGAAKRHAGLSPERRREIARFAARARWSNRKATVDLTAKKERGAK